MVSMVMPDIRQKQASPARPAKLRGTMNPELANSTNPLTEFSHIHVNIADPLPPLEEAGYFFSTINRSARWLEAIHMAETSATY